MKLTYNISQYLPNGVAPSKLQEELVSNGVLVNSVSLTVLNCIIDVDEPIGSVIEARVLDTLRDHDGILPPKYKFHSASSLIQNETEITNVTEWQDLAGVYANPGFFAKDINRAFSTIAGSVKHQGGTYEIRLIEYHDDGTFEVVANTMTHGDDANADWHTFSMITTQPPSTGECLYVLQGRLNDSTSCSIRFCGIRLMEVL